MATHVRKIGQQQNRLNVLKDSERHFRSLLEQSREAMVLLDLNGVVLYASPSTQRLWGYPSRELIGRVAFEGIHPDDQENAAKLLAALVAEPGKSLSITFRFQHRDGSWRWMEGTTTNLLDDAGVGAIVGNYQDITRRKVLEQNLQFLAHASSLLSSSLDFATIWDHLVNLAVPFIADWCAVDILNEQGVFDIAAIAHKDPAKVALVSEYRQAHPIDVNDKFGLPVIIRTKQKEYIPLITDELLVTIAKSEGDLEVVRALGMTSALSVPLIVQDKGIGAITFVTSESRKRLGETDVAMAEELAHRASLALENATLYREAQQAISMRDDFIAVASHELKTPVTSLKMYAQVLQKQLARAGEESQSRSLAKMDAQLDKLTRLINDLLNVSRLQQGRLEFQEEAFDLNEVAQEAIEHIRPTSEKHHIQLEGQIERPVWGDRDRIGQVFTNLLANAIKFSPGADTVIVRLIAEPERAVVSVRDFGIGIEEEHQSSIFNQFYRVTDPDERTFPGLGIGLYISREIIRRHGGSIQVASEKGQGAEFRFTVPYTRTHTALDEGLF